MHIWIHKFSWVHASAHTPSHAFMHTYATAEDHSSAACAAWLRLCSCFCDFPACNSYIFWETWDQTIRNPSVGAAGLELWKRVWRLKVSPDVDFQEPSFFVFETFFQRDLRLANQATLASQGAAVSTSSALGYKHVPPRRSFSLGARTGSSWCVTSTLLTELFP